MLSLRFQNVIPAKAGFLPQEPSPIQGAGGDIAKRSLLSLDSYPLSLDGRGLG